MNKTWLIIKREYFTRIRNKTFIWSTILTPLIFCGIFGVSIYMSTRSLEELTVAVYDESGLFAGKLADGRNVHYEYVSRPVYDSVVSASGMEGYDGGLYIPDIDVDKPAGIIYTSHKQLGIFSQEKINDDLNDVLEKTRMIRANIDTTRLAEIRKNNISLIQKTITEDGSDAEANAGVSYAIGYAAALLIYFVILIYGSMVMRGVMEEKTNRIAEVIVSSVRPVQLMMGKIVGIGAVGLTQFLIWIALIAGGYMIIAASMSPDNLNELAAGAEASGGSAAAFAAAQSAMGKVNVPLLVGAFIFYFLGGYLFYASLFAAVGSAVNEDPQDAQSMMMPITMPIVFSIVIMSTAITNPTSSLAVWCSIIPFTSPVIMMARLPFGMPGTVPYWEFACSVLVLAAGFLFSTWLSARIYRTGILLYGKKVTWKEMLKWAFSKQ
jgi:ABC-2 type transport system permease protein